MLEKEKSSPKPTKNINTNKEIVNRVISQYFEAISRLEMDQWVSLFAEDGYIEDPVGSRPYIGHQQLAIFFKGVLRFFSEINMTIKDIKEEDEYISVTWVADAITYNNNKITFSGQEAFQIDAEGKISAAEVYWDPSMISDQLL